MFMEYAIKRNGYYESVEFQSDVVQTQGRGSILVEIKLSGNEFARYRTIFYPNVVTRLDMPDDVIFRLRSHLPFNYTVPGYNPHYYDKKKVGDYLYEITYGKTDYDYAYENFIPAEVAGCSSIRNGAMFGRNFDWKYDKHVEFVVHTPSSLERYGTLGIASIIPSITTDNAGNATITYEGKDMHKLLPFYINDGINERGLFCTHNVVPLDDEDDPTVEIAARIEERARVCIQMLPRFILDRFASASDAIRYVRDYVTLFFPDEMITDWKYQSHFLIGDARQNYVVEFKEGRMKVIPAPYITNFPISEVAFAEDGTVQYPPTEYGMHPLGMGLERWNIIADGYANAGTKAGMEALLDSLKYSNTYGEPFWCSEIVGMDDDYEEVITVDTNPEDCTESISLMREYYEERSRTTANCWITCHSAIYDMAHRRLYVKSQEGDVEYQFSL